MRISDWSSDVCSSDLGVAIRAGIPAVPRRSAERAWPPVRAQAALRTSWRARTGRTPTPSGARAGADEVWAGVRCRFARGQPMRGDDWCNPLQCIPCLETEVILAGRDPRSEEHTSELQSLMRNSYAVFCLKKKTNTQKYT